MLFGLWTRCPGITDLPAAVDGFVVLLFTVCFDFAAGFPGIGDEGPGLGEVTDLGVKRLLPVFGVAGLFLPFGVASLPCLAFAAELGLSDGLIGVFLDAWRGF